jgi:hypothetical protein
MAEQSTILEYLDRAFYNAAHAVRLGRRGHRPGAQRIPIRNYSTSRESAARSAKCVRSLNLTATDCQNMVGPPCALSSRLKSLGERLAKTSPTPPPHVVCVNW